MRDAAGWGARWREVFSIDLRTLALFRFLLGSVIAVDMANRLADVRTFYTDWGVMPRELAELFAGPLRVSVHLANGETWFAALLLILEGFAALALACGYRTRLATLLAFVLQGSLLNRNAIILLGGDTLLACLLFWGLFLPLNARWSVDAALAEKPLPAEPRQYLSAATVGLLLQVLSVYFFSAFLKSGREWWPDGTAVYYTMTLERYSSPLGQQLLHFPGLMHFLSYFVYFLELLGPVLALSPLMHRPLRFTVMLCLMAMHTSFVLFMEIGHFPFVSLCSLTTLLGGWFWDWRAGLDERRRPIGPKIYYDRECGFCVKSCLLFKTFLVLPRATIAPAQDFQRTKNLLEANYSWVVIDDEDRAHLKWRALVALVRASPLFCWLWPLLRWNGFERPGNSVYDFIGRHRARLGQATSALLPYRPMSTDLPAWTQVVAASFVVALLAWNMVTVHWLPQSVARGLAVVLRPLRIDQTWNMFAPTPWRDDGWYLIPGQLEDGTELDVLTRKPIDYSKPKDVAATEPNIRWRTYHTLIWDPEFADNRPYYARWICRDWNVAAPAGKHLLTFKIIYMLERAVPPGQSAEVDTRIMWQQDCLGKEKPSHEQEAPPERTVPVKEDKKRPV